MKDPIIQIFDDLRNAETVEQMGAALKKKTGTLDKAQQAKFLLRVQTEFLQSQDSHRAVTGKICYGHIHMLDADDLGRGFHITYRTPETRAQPPAPNRAD